jgi:hypothetical protein
MGNGKLSRLVIDLRRQSKGACVGFDHAFSRLVSAYPVSTSHTSKKDIRTSAGGSLDQGHGMDWNPILLESPTASSSSITVPGLSSSREWRMVSCMHGAEMCLEWMASSRSAAK